MMADDVSTGLVSIPLHRKGNPLALTETDGLRRSLMNARGPFRAPMLLPEAFREMAHRISMRLDDHAGDPWALTDAKVLVLDADVRLFAKRVSAALSARDAGASEVPK
jgi:hypothetical protein